MPKAKTKKPQASAPAAPAPANKKETVQPTAANPYNLPVRYPEVVIAEYSSTSKVGPLTVDRVKTMLQWETEVEYKDRMVKENPGANATQWSFDIPSKTASGEVVVGYHCLNTDKVKVRCWNNANNRPFDIGWCEDLVHTILNGQWAGPLMLPGETVNGETVRISRYGRVLSGQHQGTALVLADELLQKSRAERGNAVDPKYPAWNGQEHCVIETVVITGLNEDERVLQSIDYVKPRTLADMLYTQPLFRERPPKDRQELTRMLAVAADLLWDRTSAQGYKTHLEMAEFLKRHKRLLKCVEHLFIENAPADQSVPCVMCNGTGKGPSGIVCPPCEGKGELPSTGRRISKLHISAGQAAALCYLMGSSGPGTDGDVYRNEIPPTEKGLDWSRYDRACEFWARLAGDRAFMQVRHALGRLVDSTPNSEENQGLGGRMPEKMAIIAKAWDKWKDYPTTDGAPRPFDEEDLEEGGCLFLSYINLDDKGEELPDGQIKLLDVADFFGIDCPEVIGAGKGGRHSTGTPPAPPPPTREEIERATEEARRRRKK